MTDVIIPKSTKDIRKIAKDQRLSGPYIRKWAHNMYMLSLNTHNISNKEVRTAVENLNIYKSHMRRMEKLRLLLTLLIVPSPNVLMCSIIRVRVTDQFVNLAYVYSDVFREPSGNIHTIIRFICTGVNMVSADGEYRGRIVWNRSLEQLRGLFTALIDDLEKFIISRNYVVDIINFHVYGKFTDLRHESARVAPICIIITWFCEMYLIYYKIQSTHTNPIFNKTMFTSDDVNMFKQLLDSYGESEIKSFYRICSTTAGVAMDGKHNNITIGVECGQKLMPLKIKEAIDVMNPIHRVWREIIIWQIVSHIPLNLIAPGIPVMSMWIFINNSQRYLFENQNMIDSHSSSQDKNKKDIGNTSIAIMCESIGTTVLNILRLQKSPSYAKTNIEPITSKHNFMKYLFEITYTLYCMNTKCDTIHADLHLNNTCIYSLYNTDFVYTIPELTVSPDKGDIIIYHVGNGMYYHFQHIVKIGSIIDFSRSIIKPDTIKTKFKSPYDRRVFMESQTDSILRWYSNTMPDFYNTYGSKIRKLCETQFNAVFKLFTAVDMCTHCVLLSKYFEKNAYLNIHDDCKRIMKKIIVLCKYYLENGMRNMCDNNEWCCTEWPNLEIIKRCFSDYLIVDYVNAFKDKRVVDYFNYDNPLKYSPYDPTKYPIRFTAYHLDYKDWNDPRYKGTTYTGAIGDNKINAVSKYIQKQRKLYNSTVDKLAQHITI